MMALGNGQEDVHAVRVGRSLGDGSPGIFGKVTSKNVVVSCTLCGWPRHC